ncbi:hypothetical protein A0H81_14051 [Grifola frondosa]|uniref:Uncharacterized protein n=1 Tax=Grifola frondosa TaxID=5627 RepID=A0A1C7LPF0_GRIFR|nr:hypothetical protein A0H81_14051 [Grifola frondosa]
MREVALQESIAQAYLRRARRKDRMRRIDGMLTACPDHTCSSTQQYRPSTDETHLGLSSTKRRDRRAWHALTCGWLCVAVAFKRCIAIDSPIAAVPAMVSSGALECTACGID